MSSKFNENLSNSLSLLLKLMIQEMIFGNTYRGCPVYFIDCIYECIDTQ